MQPEALDIRILAKTDLDLFEAVSQLYTESTLATGGSLAPRGLPR